MLDKSQMAIFRKLATYCSRHPRKLNELKKKLVAYGGQESMIGNFLRIRKLEDLYLVKKGKREEEKRYLFTGSLTLNRDLEPRVKMELAVSLDSKPGRYSVRDEENHGKQLF